MRSQEARLRNLEQSLAQLRPSRDAGAAREKLAAQVRTAGGSQAGESLADATARILGLTSGELMATLRERANA